MGCRKSLFAFFDVFHFELFAFKTVGFQSSRSLKNKGGEAFHGMRQRPVACFSDGNVLEYIQHMKTEVVLWIQRMFCVS